MKQKHKKYCILILCLTAVLTASATPWIKDAANECAIWNPNPKKHESIIWKGDIKNGKAHGLGTVIWKVKGIQTEKAEGNWIEGRLHGSAVWQNVNGSIYEGQWKNGQKDGYGIYTWPNGTKFIGLYKNDQRELGQLIDPNGNKDKRIQTSVIREIIYKAQDAAIQARKTATKARLQNKKREPQISTPACILKPTAKETKKAQKKKDALLDDPINEVDPSAK